MRPGCSGGKAAGDDVWLLVRFEVLGLLRAFRAERQLLLGWPRQQAVLAALLMNQGHVMPRDELVDAVWGTHAPATASNVVHSYVARLRKILEPGRARREPGSVLVSEGHGYALQLAPEQLDLALAGQRLAAARQARTRGNLDEAVAHMDAALALWHGTALAGIPGPLAQVHRVRLAEMRLATQEERAEVMLSLGQAPGLIGELSTLVACHPFRERLTELLMRALCLTGRQAEALVVYQRARRALVDELGVEPGPGLRRVHHQVLVADPALTECLLWRSA
ncbi:MAG TPA: AfsR/SARP family transcriptional regulator [Streptosporangiaceae bacterium]|nr:AfsR/SARP family transcriptional regulator [Streptosporangiaceae bacterium]